jgi:hypothetical protein
MNPDAVTSGIHDHMPTILDPATMSSGCIQVYEY